MTVSLRLRAALAAALLLFAAPIFAAPFTDNLDGTVTDDATGLMWDKCSWGQSNDTDCSTGSASSHTWAEALGVAVTANAAIYKGYDDWRLPNQTELESLADLSISNPTIDTAAFPNTASGWYWSSTTYTSAPAYAWNVGFSNGDSGADLKIDTFQVRLVRSGQSFGAFDAQAPDDPAEIPTLSQWAAILLMLLLTGLGLRRMRLAPPRV